MAPHITMSTDATNYNALPAAEASARIIAAIIDGLLCIPLACTIVGPLVYSLTKDALPFLGGQSVGKKMMKIRAVTETGESLSGNWGPAVIRQVVFVIPFFWLVELVVLLTGKDGLRFGDKWAKTKVVKVG